MKTLLLDIETAPNIAYVWGLFDQNIALNQLESSSYVLCWSAKWLGDDVTHFQSIEHHSEKTILRPIHKMLNEADIVVHYNGMKFDIPVLNKDFLRHGFAPPAPYKQIDLMRVCKQAFRFESNKLQYVSEALGLGGKVKHEGFGLWIKCMRKDSEAWEKMEAYNRGDVDQLEKLYRRLLPWISKHPNQAAASDTQCCPKCGSVTYQRRGTAITATLKYHRYQCASCGGWFRGSKIASLRKGERMTNL